MISADQPKIFASRLIVAVSSVTDGNMRAGVKKSDEDIFENRRKFLSRNMISMQGAILCGVTYDRTDFTQYTVVNRGDRGKGMLPDTETIIADGIATDEKGCALFLPLADCAGVIFYDPVGQGRLMLAHLGRHSVEQYGAKKCVEFMQYKFGSRPEDIIAWIGPSPNVADYPLWKRENQSFREAIVADLKQAGIADDHFEISKVDTVTDQNYFSHSEFLKGNRPTDGRYAIAVKLR